MMHDGEGHGMDIGNSSDSDILFSLPVLNIVPVSPFRDLQQDLSRPSGDDGMVESVSEKLFSYFSIGSWPPNSP